MAPPVAGDGGDGGGGGGGGGGRQQQQQQPGMGQMLTGVIRMAIFWYFASKFFSPKRAPSDPSVQISNLFHKGEPLDMWLYLSEQEKFNDFGSETALFWHETNIPYAVWGHESSRSLSLKYFPSEALKHNGSLYAHVFFARSGYPPDPSDPEYQPLAAFGRTHPVVTYLPKSKADKKKSLLGNTEDSKDESDVPKVVEEDMADSKEDVPVEWVSYWKPNFTISLVDDFTRYTQNAVPPNIAPFLNIEPTTGNYFPTVFFNEFWLLRDKLIPINDTVTELPLHLEVSPISMTKWQLFMQIDQSFQIHRSYGSMLEGESDELKRVFLEGNPYLLGITMVVSLLHSVFDFLAFKNDIQFWNKNKSMEGLSAKSVIVNFICQLIVFLYLLDNETSWMILASSGIGCCIEFWKIGKAMHIEIDRSGKIPMLRFRDRESYAGNKTKEYDDLAMKYLSYLLFFLVVCFSIYSLMYDRHKSWYSWILSSLTSCVYMFGFIMMCPQLFINYKLKSVAHLPWRQMTYKFLNTIIDDLFAFVIKMPTLHRLSVFRDDLIFLIYLYQRWIYPGSRMLISTQMLQHRAKTRRKLTGSIFYLIVLGGGR
ncbi:PREDICTED: cleft lip and palate transmembrane protein 1 homolog isoform X2 [Ipomoea nil]|uniref:cleft lip and palate transmembrane protein 1 homolog isoform X2 n=1 Tax=Ipomoea nil TaxID=35883 RepID=UPI000901FBA3|nr:PREDICTED: cleft lip and palate transmembrane protein 1 homolog isoform X2 [Ipomoea nil]XP_019184202.1 PREDICTED: cleft lip and palate transmembrane protein 1 homolog isoform X2 [Ipomoea nil]XP_019184203.1 PREDICTED: cleft lip and palate transmembrane protein 1 homolog isoform X2 [Ipomoea nil]